MTRLPSAMRSRFWFMVDFMLEDVFELILERLLTLEVSQNQANQLFCVLFIVPFKHLLPRIVHKKNDNQLQIFFDGDLLIFWLSYHEFQELLQGLVTRQRS